MTPKDDDTIQKQLDEVIDVLQSRGVPMFEAEEFFRKKYIRSALRKTNGSSTRAARLLNVHRNTLGYDMRRLGLAPHAIAERLKHKERRRRMLNEARDYSDY